MRRFESAALVTLLLSSLQALSGKARGGLMPLEPGLAALRTFACRMASYYLGLTTMNG